MIVVCAAQNCQTQFDRPTSGRRKHQKWCGLPCLRREAWRRFCERGRKPSSDYFHARAIQNRYGIDANEYAAMLERQNGVCAICRKSELNGRRLAVDHDHRTGRVRGLLCYLCNRAIERLDSNHDWARAAMAYLQSKE